MINLSAEIEKIKGANKQIVNKLKRLEIKTVKDLLWHFPFRYEDFRKISKISDLEIGQNVTIRGIVRKISIRRSWRRKIIVVEALIIDETGGISAIWFNQPYIYKILTVGREANFAGKVVSSSNKIYLSNPIYEILKGTTETKHTAGLIPIYPETKGLTSKGLRYLIKPILKELEQLKDFIPFEILKKFNLLEINTALKKIHFPKTLEQAQEAKRRFAFEDLFLLQLNNLKLRLELNQQKAPILKISDSELNAIFKNLPFELTPSQKRSLEEIINDLSKSRPMNRLLQGDVGSGKTVIAAIASLIAAKNNKQTAFMAPTEVLARQHYKTFEKIFGLPAALLLGAEKGNKKKKILEEIATGKTKIIIGTHALIQKNVKFNDLALIIIDEQHRFGVKQRAALARRSSQIDTQINADKNGEGFLYKDLTYQIRGAIFDVYNKIGSGHKENIYHNALIEELTKRKLQFDTEKNISIKYNDKKIGVYRPDFVIENKVILEIKALPFIGKIEERQIWYYLKGSDYKLALIANFGNNELQIKRVVYEQARNQRKSASNLRESALVVPHFLSMSATPIPRTLSLTIFGDLDLSTIDELPKGRKPILTKIVAPENRNKAYDFIRQQIKKGRQAFVICPRIEPSARNNADDTPTHAEIPRMSALSQRQSALWDVKAVKEEYEKISKQIFPDLRVAMLHGKLKSVEKEKIMTDFANGKINLLVSTSVIEVGVDVPNATIMMIEGADRFGLAQLYQFRGRVGRSEHQSFCFLFTESSSPSTKARLNAIIQAKNGFELAEKDLAIRGPGQFLGEKQTGLPDLAMNALNNIELIKQSRLAAQEIIDIDPNFEKHPFLKEKFENFQKQIHLE